MSAWAAETEVSGGTRVFCAEIKWWESNVNMICFIFAHAYWKILPRATIHANTQKFLINLTEGERILLDGRGKAAFDTQDLFQEPFFPSACEVNLLTWTPRARGR